MNVAQIEPEAVRPLSRPEYDKLVELGVFEDEHVELLYGMVVRMTPRGPSHDSHIDRLNEIFVQALVPRAKVRIQSAFAAADHSEPEPDVVIAPRREYDDEHPSEAYLVVEVARSSLARERDLKARLYAESGVQEYWIVNLVDDVVEVHTEIISGRYSRVAPYGKGDHIRLQQFPDVEVAIDDVLR